MIVRGTHGAEMENILVVHFIAKPHTYGSRRLANVVATALKWAELRMAIDELVRPNIVYECYRLPRKHAIFCRTIKRIQLRRVIRVVRTSWSRCIDSIHTE